jgi:hypothetical protein
VGKILRLRDNFVAIERRAIGDPTISQSPQNVLQKLPAPSGVSCRESNFANEGLDEDPSAGGHTATAVPGYRPPQRWLPGNAATGVAIGAKLSFQLDDSIGLVTRR